MTSGVIVASMAEWFVKTAYVIWDKLISYCYDTLKVSPFEFGQLTEKPEGGSAPLGLIAQVFDKSETVIIGVGTGLLLLVWVIGILREGGNLISDRTHPYALITHIVRFFICEGLITGYLFIVKSIFDLFTIATRAVIGDSSNYGLVDPSNTSLKQFFGATAALDGFQGKESQAIVEVLFASKGLTDVFTGNAAITDILLVDILSLIYLVVVIACAIVIFMKVYGRYFRVIISIALTPIGISFFGAAHTEQNARKFIFYLLKQGAEGLIIALDLMLFGILAKGGTSVTPDLVKAVANGAGGDAQISMILAFLISQIFFCILLMTLVSASEKMVEQLL